MKILKIPYGTTSEEEFISDLETQIQQFKVKISTELLNTSGFKYRLILDRYCAEIALARKSYEGLESWKHDHYCSFLDEAEGFLNRHEIEN